MNFLGIDVGTGGSRAVVVDTRGRLVASAAAAHEPFASRWRSTRAGRE